MVKGVKKIISLIIATHGKFSEELIKSSEIIAGKQENVTAITFESGEGLKSLTSRITKVLTKEYYNDGVVFLVDLFGGSPFNVISTIVYQTDNMYIITGVNLPMLLEAVILRMNLGIEELVAKLEYAGKEGIIVYKNLCENVKEDDL